MHAVNCELDCSVWGADPRTLRDAAHRLRAAVSERTAGLRGLLGPTTRRLEIVRDPSDAEDIAKVEEILAGDSAAFEFLFDKYRDRVYRVAQRFVRNKEDALEVTQEVFLRVHQSLHSFKTNSKFFTWLYRITVNRAIDFTRSRKNRPLKEVDTPFLEAQASSLPGRAPVEAPSQKVEDRELAGQIASAVAGLPEKHRAVFLLHAGENLSYREIADVVECNVGTVMSRLFYARKKLREQLQRLGVDPPIPSGADD